MPDVSISALNAQLNSRISDWADSFGGMLRKLERNRFLLLFEAKDLARMADGKFSLLESVRSVTSPSGIPATVSIGIGKDGVDFREDYDFAALSIEMALSRGGDQAVIKDRYDFTFFGGRTKQTERRTKVKSRVMASSLSETHHAVEPRASSWAIKWPISMRSARQRALRACAARRARRPTSSWTRTLTPAASCWHSCSRLRSITTFS